MRKARVTVTVDEELLALVDARVECGESPNRSAAIEKALRRWQRAEQDDAFSRQLDQLDPAEEQALAEEGMADYAALVAENEAS